MIDAIDSQVVDIANDSTTIAGSFCFFPRGIRFNSLIIDPNDAATGNVTFLFAKA